MSELPRCITCKGEDFTLCDSYFAIVKTGIDSTARRLADRINMLPRDSGLASELTGIATQSYDQSRELLQEKLEDIDCRLTPEEITQRLNLTQP